MFSLPFCLFFQANISIFCFKVLEELDLTVEQWNAADTNGDTAFHYAAKFVSSKTVQYFEFLKKKGVVIKV